MLEWRSIEKIVAAIFAARKSKIGMSSGVLFKVKAPSLTDLKSQAVKTTLVPK